MSSIKKSAKKEAKKHISVKNSFSSPFSSNWSALPQSDMTFILKTLQDKLTSTGLQKKEVKACPPWRRKKKKNPISTSEPVPQVSQGQQVSDPIKNGWTDVAARRQLAIGINEVTKALERNELQLLLVCKSVRPQNMTNHLIALSATRGVPACQVPRLSESVSEPLKLKSVLALGFRRCSEDGEMFTDIIDAIKPRVPPLDVAWLRSVTPEHHAVNKEEREGEAAETRGQKRKLESESEKVTESPSSSCTLQPLKVKRIVANPAKKQKAKIKKKKQTVK